MASGASTAGPAAEATFRDFSQKQGTNYAQNRLAYHARLYEILNASLDPRAEHDLVLDVGCGPGFALHHLAAHYSHALGLDPSEGMIATARAIGGVSASGAPIRYEVGAAEDLGANLGQPVPDGSVDLLVAANAAHWFDMAAFWRRAAQVLKPGGAVALWTSGSIRLDMSVPNRAAAQAALDRLLTRVDAYRTPGNRTNESLYADLPLPWTLGDADLAETFDQASFVRREWGTGEGAERPDEFYAMRPVGKLDALEKVLGTTSPVIRWREANPADAGTARDVVVMTMAEVRQALREGGVEDGEEDLKGGVAGALLVVKKKRSIE